MSTGAVLGAGLGLTWNLLWPGTPVGAFAMVAAAAMIGAAMQAPATGLVLVATIVRRWTRRRRDGVAAPVNVDPAMSERIRREMERGT